MRIEIRRYLPLTLLCGLVAEGALGQEIQLGQNYLEFDYQAQPGAVAGSLWADATAELGVDGRIVIHRTLSDQANQVYYGYAIVLERSAPADPYRASFRALSMRAQDLVIGQDLQHPARAAGWSYRAPPELPASVMLTPGSGISFALSPAGRNGGLRDSIAVEGKFFLTALRSSRAPSFVLVRQNVVRGQMFWVYVPGQGRFILSTAPRAELRFEKAGTARGLGYSFTFGGAMYDLKLAQAVEGDVAEHPLYVLHDPTYEPAARSEKDRVVTGAISATEIAHLLK